MKAGELRKTSATIDGTFTPGIFNLDVVYDYLNITEDITLIKYNGMKKTNLGEEECSTFNNQITVKIDGVTIKIFKSKTFSLSGAGNADTAIEKAEKTLKKLLNILNEIKITKKVKLGNCGMFYTYYNDKIISKVDEKYIFSNTIRNGKAIIGGFSYIEFDLLPGCYIQEKHKEKKKKLCNNLTEEIGYVEYIMKRKSASLCIKDCVYVLKSPNEYEITNSYGNFLGIMKIVIFENKAIVPVVLPEYVDLELVASDSHTSLSTIKFSNCNYNMKFLCESIDRNSVCSYLEDQNIQYTYNPSSYPGVKFKIGEVKITVFRTGSILFSSKEDVTKEAYPFVIKMFESNLDLPLPQEDLCSDIDSSLTIWDI
jgi:TATA-box binding protein (TBP) (component of TFIID and TFIIIB)